MTLQVLLSAMHLEDYRYIDKLNIKGDAVVINQCDRQEKQEIEEESRRVLFVSTLDRGLSKSRNMALDLADSEIGIFCDNDVVFSDDAGQEILDAFAKDQEADIIVFFIQRPERKTPIYSSYRDLGYKGAMKVFSPEIAFRTKSLKKQDLRMNEYFGAGAKYGMGEENIFLFEAIGKGLKVKYCPLKIAELMETESTWFKGYTDKYFMDRGAGYYAMSKKWYKLLILQFAIRKWKLYKNDNKLGHALGCMFKGAKEYETICNRGL